MDLRGGRDQGVLDEMILLAMHELCPCPKHGSIGGQDIVGRRNLIEPCLDLGSFGRVLFAGYLDPCLDLGERYGAEVKVLVGNTFDPGEDGTMRTWTTEFRDDVRVEQKHGSGEPRGHPAARAAPRRHRKINPPRIGEQ